MRSSDRCCWILEGEGGKNKDVEMENEQKYNDPV